MGVAKIFTPGAATTEIVDWVRGHARPAGVVRPGREDGRLATHVGPARPGRTRLRCAGLPHTQTAAPHTEDGPEWTCLSIRRRSSSPSTGCPFPQGRVAHTPAEARAIAEAFAAAGKPHVVVKAQVKAGGRGKAGGVKLADDPGRAPRTRPARSSAWTSRATPCTRSWSRRPATSRRSTTCRTCSTAPTARFLSICSVQGGMEIEEVAHTNPEAVARMADRPAGRRGRGQGHRDRHRGRPARPRPSPGRPRWPSGSGRCSSARTPPWSRSTP